MSRPGMGLQLTINILTHLLAHDDAPHLSTDGNGALLLPELPSSEPLPRKRKILVYHEFTMMVQTLKMVPLLLPPQVSCSPMC